MRFAIAPVLAGPVVAVLLAVLLVSWNLATLFPRLEPTPHTKALYRFNATRAFEDLKVIAARKHSVSNPDITAVRDYIMDSINNAISDASKLNPNVTSSVQVELDDRDHILGDSDGIANPFRKTGVWVLQSNNLMVRVKGSSAQSPRSAFMLIGHYDGAGLSYGASDAGVGVVTMLEILRTVLQSPEPLRHDLIFNFDCWEEEQLFGAESFVRHPWFADVRAYIDLEGIGVGGLSVLFRGRGQELYNALVKEQGTSLIMSGLGRDILDVVPSGTDYSVYDAQGVPGLDLTLFQRRSLYHTRRDNAEETGPYAIAHHGHTALSATRGIANAEWLPHIPRSPIVSHPQFVRNTSHSVPIIKPSEDPWRKPLFSYDILGRWTFVHTPLGVFWTTLSIALLTAAVVSAGGGKAYHSRLAVRSTVLGNDFGPSFGLSVLAPLARLLAAICVSVVLSALFSFVSGWVITKANPLVSHAHPILYLVALHLAAFGVYSGIINGPFAASEHRRSQSILQQIQSPLSSEAVRTVQSIYGVLADPAKRRRWLWYVQPLTWSLLLLLVLVPLAANDVSLFHHLPWFLGTSFVGALLTAVLDTDMLGNSVARLFEYRTASSTEESEPLLQPESDTAPVAHAQIPPKVSAAIIATRFAVAVVLPLVLHLQALYLSISALHQAIQDGTPPILLALVGAVGSTWTALILSPYLASSWLPCKTRSLTLATISDPSGNDDNGDHRAVATDDSEDEPWMNSDATPSTYTAQVKADRSALLSALVWLVSAVVVTTWLSAFASPFDSGDAPMKIKVGLFTELTVFGNDKPPQRPDTIVTVRAMDHDRLKQAIKDVPSFKSDSRGCKPVQPSGTYLDCRYALDLNATSDIIPSLDKRKQPVSVKLRSRHVTPLPRASHSSNGNGNGDKDEQQYLVVGEAQLMADDSRNCWLSIAPEYFARNKHPAVPTPPIPMPDPPATSTLTTASAAQPTSTTASTATEHVVANEKAKPRVKRVEVQRAYFTTDSLLEREDGLNDLPPVGDLTYQTPHIQLRDFGSAPWFRIEYIVTKTGNSKKDAPKEIDGDDPTIEPDPYVWFTASCAFEADVPPLSTAVKELEAHVPDWAILTGMRPLYEISTLAFL